MSVRALTLLDATRAGETSATDCGGCLARELTRRGFVTAAASSFAALALAACGGGGEGPTGSGGGGGASIVDIPMGANLTVSANGQVVTIPLASNPSLAAAGGMLFLASARTLVLNTGNEYRAFTSVCTHQGCDVMKRHGERFHCDCHGSEYDQTGSRVSGPAESPLRQYATTLDVAANAVVVTKG
jgi:cytochrome b6-f complex iron-sulfur subunit